MTFVRIANQAKPCAYLIWDFREGTVSGKLVLQCLWGMGSIIHEQWDSIVRLFGAGSVSAQTASGTSSGSTTSPPSTTESPQFSLTAALRSSNQSWMASLECACDSGLEAAKTGASLREYLAYVRFLKDKGEHWVIAPVSWKVEWIHFQSSHAATAGVWKDELSQLYQGGTVIRHCYNPYEVRYQLVKIGAVWKVSVSDAHTSTQTCVNSA